MWQKWIKIDSLKHCPEIGGDWCRDDTGHIWTDGYRSPDYCCGESWVDYEKWPRRPDVVCAKCYQVWLQRELEEALM
jgi:hypothetical protein